MSCITSATGRHFCSRGVLHTAELLPNRGSMSDADLIAAQQASIDAERSRRLRVEERENLLLATSASLHEHETEAARRARRAREADAEAQLVAGL